jgi:alcohol dehydrogenase/L-iditol 2-dehydrogenase
VGLEADRHRLNIAKHYGCDVIVGDASGWARERDGLGADCVIDAAGVSATLKIAMELVRPNGHITKVGWGPQPLGFSIDPLVQKNVTLQGSFSHNWPIWERVIALLASGQLDVKPIIGGVWPITEWHEAFEKMHKGEVSRVFLNLFSGAPSRKSSLLPEVLMVLVKLLRLRLAEGARVVIHGLEILGIRCCIDRK